MHDTKAAPRLVIRRVLQAPRAKVFAAWTQPQQMRRWYCPNDHTVADVQSDLRVGGAYRITMQGPEERIAVRGTYREVREPERLSYTWSWEEDSPDDEIETLVSVDFIDLGERTEIVLTHERFAGQESRDRHEGGWNQVLDNLASYVAVGD